MKKSWLVFLIIVIVLGLLAGGVYLYYPHYQFNQREKALETAKTAVDAGNLDEADAILIELLEKDHPGAEELRGRIEHIRADRLFQEEKYADALDYAQQHSFAQDEIDAYDRAERYHRAEALSKSDEGLEEALALFTGLGDYEDSINQAESCASRLRVIEAAGYAAGFDYVKAVKTLQSDPLTKEHPDIERYPRELAEHMAESREVMADRIAAGYWYTSALGTDGVSVYGLQLHQDPDRLKGGRIISGPFTMASLNEGHILFSGYSFVGQEEAESQTGIMDAAIGFNHVLLVMEDGTAAAFGQDELGKLDVNAWTGVTDAAAGMYHSAALLENGTVVAEAAQTGVSMPGGMPAEAELSMARAAQGNTPENADAANLAQTTGTTIQGSANALTDNAAPSRDTGSSLWQGIPMAIENAVSMPRDESNRQNLGDMLRQQNQEQAAQAVPAASEGEASMPGAAFTPTMAEEIVPNAGQQSQPMTAANAFAPAAGFTNAAAAAETAAPESAAPVRDTYEVVRQIVDQARLIRSNENTQMVIRLRPEHLGEITLRVSITAEGVINASFRSDNAQVRAILESSMVQLKQQLQEQGVKVDQVDVQSGLSEDFFSHGQAGQQDFQQNQSQSAQSQQLARRAFEEEAEGLSASGTAEAAEAEPGQAPMGADSGVDYRV